MFIYSVTVSLNPEIEQEWLDYMRKTHIKDVLATNCFIDCKLSRIHGEEEFGVTYSIMYLMPSEEKYNEYQEQFAPSLQKDHTDKFEGQFATFRTTLSVIEHFTHDVR